MMKILKSYKKIAKSMLTEHTWDRKFGEPLPTLEDTARKHEQSGNYRPGKPEHKPGDVWQTSSGWAAWRPGDKAAEYGIEDKENAVKWAKGKIDPDSTSGSDDEKEPTGKLGGGDFDRDGGEKSDKGGDTKKVSSVDDDTYDETEDAMDNLRYSGTPSDEPMMIKHLGDMVDNFMSGNASDEDVDKAQEIADTLDNISQTNDEDPEAFDKLGMALQVGIDQHKKLKGESKTLEINGKQYKEVKEEKKVVKKHPLKEMFERISKD